LLCGAGSTPERRGRVLRRQPDTGSTGRSAS